MTKELERAERELCYILVPFKEFLKDVHADSVGLFLTGLTLGFVRWDKVSCRVRGNDPIYRNHQYVVDAIGLEEPNFSLS